MKILILILSLSLFLNLVATIINIPADQPTIQIGLNVAIEGDTVLVAAGTYYENILWPATNGIKLIGSSEEECIIDGNQQLCVIRFEDDLRGIIDTTTIVKGFTIQNGQAVYGGGVKCSNSSPILENNIIMNNSVSWVGGGVYCWYSNPILKNVTLMNNTALRGGGISFWHSNSNLENVIIENNSATDNGGGIQCYSSSNLDLENVTITENNADNKGAGIYCDNSILSLSNVTITENVANYKGGGIYLDGNSDSILQNVFIMNNSTTTSSGGGIFINGSSNPMLTNVLIADNDANLYGGGICIDNSSNPMLTNVTIVNNSASYNGGGIYCTYYSDPIFVNSILWSNTPQEIYLNSGSVTATYSDIEGGWIGDGNIDTDPLFVDSLNQDYHLTANSPCIDTGDPNYPFDPDGTISDMGAFYFDQLSSINDNEIQFVEYNLSNFPNPFNPTTTINFSIQNDSKVELSIYNIKGQKTKALAQNEFTKGDHSIIWNGDDDFGKPVSSGVYYYQLQVGNEIIITEKCLLLK